MTITDFEELEEAVIQQQLSVGASEEEIVFPDTLNVTASPAEDTLTYDGAAKEASVFGTISGVTGTPTISYSQIDENGQKTSLTGKPTNVGEYEASISCGEGANAVTVSVTYWVTAIAKNAFRNCKKLKTVTIGSSIRTIGDHAFFGCKNLETVKYGKNTTTIGKQAFFILF